MLGGADGRMDGEQATILGEMYGLGGWGTSRDDDNNEDEDKESDNVTREENMM